MRVLVHGQVAPVRTIIFDRIGSHCRKPVRRNLIRQFLSWTLTLRGSDLRCRVSAALIRESGIPAVVLLNSMVSLPASVDFETVRKGYVGDRQWSTTAVLRNNSHCE